MGGGIFQNFHQNVIRKLLFLEGQNDLRKSGFMVNFSGSNYALRKCIDGFVLIRVDLVGSLSWNLK